MLQIRNLTYSIGDRQLLDEMEWLIQPGKRVALVGPNGVGKTTLLRILNGDLEYNSGSIIKPREYRIGYLPQEEIAVTGTNILDTVLAGQKEVKLLEQKIAHLHEELTHAENNRDQLLEQLGILEHRFEAMDGYHLEIQAKSILSGLGFKKADLNRSLAEFSGGWRMRVYLALLLVLKPDLLLLDEPTNHLDIPSLEWLEQYLLSFPGSIVAVSHDRFFIDRLAQDIVELDRGKIVHYPGNYHKYESLKEIKIQLQLKRWREQKTEREKQEKFINRFRYKNTKAKQVQSRLRQLEKMDGKEVELPPQMPPNLDFTLAVAVPSYNDVLTIKNMSFRYDEPWILRDTDLTLYRGEKISLVGPNGVGKTTLTRLISQQLQPQEGCVVLGERVSIGYYAQHQVDALNLDATVYEEVASTTATSLLPKLRDVLGIFQFTGNDVYKKISVLSGGEKARVSLAKILISPVNFLIMDEPTNHLDKNAREALENALSKYNGTLLLISHDRYFLDKLVHRVVEIRDGKFVQFDGNYTYYLQKRDALPDGEKTGKEKASEKPNGKNGSINVNLNTNTGTGSESADTSVDGARKTKEQKRREAQARQAVSESRNVLKKNVSTLEAKIETLEDRKTELETQLAHPDTYGSGNLAVRLQKEYAQVNKDLKVSNEQWETALMELEELEATLASN